MSKKRILITMTYMHIGGAERSLLGLLDTIDYNSYEVDLFLFSHEGEYMELIPEKVNLLPEIKAYKALTTPLNDLKNIDKRAYWKKKTAVTIARILYALKGSRCSENGVTLCCECLLVPGLPRINDIEYDLGISFMSYHSILHRKASCKKTIGWFHSDYTTVNPIKLLDFISWNNLNNIAMVSEECRDSFVAVYPNLRHKTIAIENIIPKQQVIKQSEQKEHNMGVDLSTAYMLSVGRLCPAKAYTRAIQAFAIMKKQGVYVRWYVLGDGESKESLSDMIQELGCNQSFVLLGSTANPYPLMANCGIFIQTSDFEGKSVAVREAQILGKPVLITNYETAHSQVDNGVDGIIVEKTPEAVAEGIINLLNHPEIREKLGKNCMSRDYSNSQEIEKIYALIS